MKKFSFIPFHQLSRISLILLILGFGIGLLLTTQWKTKTARLSNPVISYASLRDTREDLTQEQTSLKKQILVLQSQIDQEQDRLKKNSISKNKVEELEVYKKQVGLTEIKDKGVIITMDDAPDGLINIDSITHAADLRDLVNFLWGAGVEAISINGERIVFISSIDCIVNTILINSTRTTTPFVISAIGNSRALKSSIENENNLKDIHKRAKSEGLIFQVIESNNITIPAYDGSFSQSNVKISQN